MLDLDIWKFRLSLCSQNLWFISVKELATFGCVLEVFLPRKLKLISENFEFVSPRKLNLSLFHQSLVGRCWGCRPVERGEKCRGHDLERRVVFSGVRSEQCQGWGCVIVNPLTPNDHTVVVVPHR